ncbi:MAG: aldo/keto reductase [Candidatus Hinthialibacter antarcticus]|nr:aldo/keto reductase [Candidatus Hinthialibacter antarcticus]
MNPLSRRDFMTHSLVGAGALTTALNPTAQQTKKCVTDRISLGRAGIKCSRLAFGTGTDGWLKRSDQTRLGQKAFVRLLRTYIDLGMNFIDLADIYGSHPYFKNVLKEVNREELVILSKMWFAGGGGMPQTDFAKPAFERFRNELGVDSLDVVLIHCVSDSKWPQHRKQMRDELSELKERGRVRAIGCSCHDFGALKVAAEDPWTEVILARINNKHMNMDEGASVEQVAQVLQTARANGKAVIGMKIFGCGSLVKEEQRETSLQYVLGNDLVDAMTIGMVNEQQIQDNMSRINRILNA